MPVNKALWTRSRRGNLYRRYPTGPTVTIFKHPREPIWTYCYADGMGAHYPCEYWPSEELALEAAHKNYCEHRALVV
jgi:hypothetical protein